MEKVFQLRTLLVCRAFIPPYFYNFLFNSLKIQTLNIQVSKDYKNKCHKLKLLSVKTRWGDLYKYIYSKADPFQLISIEKYRNPVSAFFRQKVEEKKDNLLNGFKKLVKGLRKAFTRPFKGLQRPFKSLLTIC